MTSTLERAHQDAGLNLLRSAGLTVLPDANGFLEPKPDPPYVLVYTSVGWPKTGEANAFDGLSVTCMTRWIVHCIADTENAALAVAGLVREAMLDQVPTIPGRNCDQIDFEGDAGDPANRSELGSQPRYDLTVVYSMMSVPG